jgi:hypothetical protein
LARFNVRNLGTFQMGATAIYYGIVQGQNGGSLLFVTAYQDTMNYDATMVSAGGTFLFYGGTLMHQAWVYGVQPLSFNAGVVTMMDVVVTGNGSYTGLSVYGGGGTWTLTRVTFTGQTALFTQGLANPVMTDVRHFGKWNWYHTTVSPDGAVLTGGIIGAMVNQVGSVAQRITLKNITGITTANWTFGYTGAMTASEAQRLVWTLDLTVLNESNTPLSGASVTIVDYRGVTVATLTTDINGQIPQQTLKQWTRDLLGGVVQPWVQHTPHVVTISAVGYAVRALSLTMDRARVEIEKMALAVAPGLPRTRVIGGS